MSFDFFAWLEIVCLSSFVALNNKIGGFNLFEVLVSISALSATVNIIMKRGVSDNG